MKLRIANSFHFQEYLKALAMKLSTVYEHLKKESSQNNSTRLFLSDKNPILANESDPSHPCSVEKIINREEILYDSSTSSSKGPSDHICDNKNLQKQTSSESSKSNNSTDQQELNNIKSNESFPDS